MREEIERFMAGKPLPRLRRLSPQARNAGGQDRWPAYRRSFSAMSIRKVASNAWFADLPDKLSPKQSEIGPRILKEIRERLRFLNDVGLDYLTMVAQFRHPVGR
jgi:excinuclease ABC subunit A